MVNARLDAALKHIDNTFVATLVVRDVSEETANEIMAYAEYVKESGDLYNQYAGLIKAIQIITMVDASKEQNV